MSDDETVAVEHRPPGEVFELLSSDRRVEIVQALGEAGEPMSFSALREAVSERDSGKFNYHLRKLVGYFVTQTEDGYRLSLAGDQVYGAILSGAFTANASIAPFEFDGPCPLCGHEFLLAEYTDEHAKLSCPDCGEWRNEFPFPPGSLDQFTRAELPTAFDRWMRATVTTYLQGFCANCGGRVDTRLEQSPPDASMPVRARFECDRCGEELRSSPALPVLHHPTTISFFERHGVNVLHDPSWRYYDMSVEITDEKPLRARLSLAVDGEKLVALVGPEGTVEDVTTDT